MIAVAYSHRKSFHEGWGLPHACRVCKKFPEKKAEWGCESPAREPQIQIPCVLCAGDDADCQVCNGTGYEDIYRCPRTFITPWETEYRALHRSWPGALPFAGGIWDQPAQYVIAMRIIDQAEGLMQEILEDEREAKMKGGKQ